MDFVSALQYAMKSKEEGKPFVFRRTCWPEEDCVCLPQVQGDSGIYIATMTKAIPLAEGDYCSFDWVVFHPEPEPTPPIGKPFEWALTQLKAGKRVCRKGWNGKGLALGVVDAEDWSSSIGFGRTDNAHRLPWIAMKTMDGGLVPWTASQTDLLSNDWEEAK